MADTAAGGRQRTFERTLAQQMRLAKRRGRSRHAPKPAPEDEEEEDDSDSESDGDDEHSPEPPGMSCSSRAVHLLQDELHMHGSSPKLVRDPPNLNEMPVPVTGV